MEVVFLKLLNMSITAGWLVLAVIVLRLVFRKAPKALRVIMWALVGLRLICPISFESILSLIPSAETVPMDVLNLETPAINSGITELNEAINPIISEKVTSIQVITFAASVIWIVGMMAMLLYGVISYYRIHIKVREAILLKDNIWLSDRILTPFILGVFYPRIYLPCSMNEQDMDYVIAHEKAHLSRRDHWWKPIGFILLTVYWFNPVLWIAYILLCRDIEFACDEKVIKTMGTDVKKPYSNALINCSIHRKTISVCPVAFGEVGVKGRIKSVLNYKKPSFWIVAAAIIVCLCISVCFLTNPTENNPEIVTDTLVSENNSETITDTPVPESNVGEVSDSDEIYQIEKELTDLNNQESQKYEQEKQLQVDLAEQAKEEIKKQEKNKDKDAGIIKKNKKKKTKDKVIVSETAQVVPTPEVKATRRPRPTVKPTEVPKPTEIPQQEEINPTETPVPIEDRPVGGLIMIGPYVIKDIIKIDDKTSYVDVGLCLDEKFRGMIVKDEEAANGVDTIRVIVDNYRIEKNQTKIGSEMRFIYTLGGTEKNIVGNICNVTRGLFAYY